MKKTILSLLVAFFVLTSFVSFGLADDSIAGEQLIQAEPVPEENTMTSTDVQAEPTLLESTNVEPVPVPLKQSLAEPQSVPVEPCLVNDSVNCLPTTPVDIDPCLISDSVNCLPAQPVDPCLVSDSVNCTPPTPIDPCLVTDSVHCLPAGPALPADPCLVNDAASCDPPTGTQPVQLGGEESNSAPLYAFNPLWNPSPPKPSSGTFETPTQPPAVELAEEGPDPAIVALADGRPKPWLNPLIGAPTPFPPNSPFLGLFAGANTPILGLLILLILAGVLIGRRRSAK